MLGADAIMTELVGFGLRQRDRPRGPRIEAVLVGGARQIVVHRPIVAYRKSRSDADEAFMSTSRCRVALRWSIRGRPIAV